MIIHYIGATHGVLDKYIDAKRKELLNNETSKEKQPKNSSCDKKTDNFSALTPETSTSSTYTNDFTNPKEFIPLDNLYEASSEKENFPTPMKTINFTQKPAAMKNFLSEEKMNPKISKVASDLDIPKQKKRRPKPKSKLKQFLAKEENCDKCKIQTRYSTISKIGIYDGRLCLECLDKSVQDAYEETVDKQAYLQCDFCDEKYIQPEIYIHMDKEHYENIMDIETTAINESGNEEKQKSQEVDEPENEEWPNSKLCKIDSDTSQKEFGKIRDNFDGNINSKIAEDEFQIQENLTDTTNDLNSYASQEIINSDHCREDEIKITWMKKEPSQEKAKVHLTIKENNGDPEQFLILLRMAQNNVTLADVKQHLMKKPGKYNNFDVGMYEYCVKRTLEKDGSLWEDCDEDNEMAVLPLFGNMIVLKCWLKS